MITILPKKISLYGILFYRLVVLTAQGTTADNGHNVLSQADFYAIEINGVTFRKLSKTNGEVSEMRRLFWLKSHLRIHQ